MTGGSMTDTLNAFLAHFDVVEKDRGSDRIHPLRTSAHARLAEMGLPHAKQEEWRFTSLAPIREKVFPIARPSTNGVGREQVGEPAHFVFVDGHFREDLSTAMTLPEGVKAMSLVRALEEESEIVLAHLGKYAHREDRAFVALNTAMIEDGAFIYLPKNSTVEDPIRIMHLSTGAKSSYPRHLFIAKEGSRATIVESYVSTSSEASFVNAVAEVVVGANANLDHVTLQLENEASIHMNAVQILLGRDSRYSNHKVTLGGRLTRNETDGVLDAENIVCTLNGLYHTHGEQHVDNHTWLEHRKPNCDSHELFKGILDDNSSAVFACKIHVFQEAQKTDAKQSNANLLLSDTAVIDSQPQLEIYADDVRCTHGAVVGQLDSDALFYLRSRGISDVQARNMLIRAFASEVAHRIPVESVREQVDALLTDRLPGGRMDR